VEGPAFRPGERAALLRPRDRDPDAALDGLRQVRFGVKMSKEVPMKHQERA